MSSSPFATQPPVGFGPGSQATTAEEGLEYLPLPSGMRTFCAHLPEVEDASRFTPAFGVLEEIIAALKGEGGAIVPLAHLDAPNRALVDETLGEGEVAVKAAGAEIQEATFAGVWRVRGAASDRVEVGAFPRGAILRAFPEGWRMDLSRLDNPGPGVFNAPPVVVEIAHRSQSRKAGEPVHVINLSLLPHTPEDLALFDEMLGQGATTILSRGYGNCRIDASATKDVWRVRYYNSTDMLILDTIEICDVPDVACAAPEDLADSAERLADVLAAIR